MFVSVPTVLLASFGSFISIVFPSPVPSCVNVFQEFPPSLLISIVFPLKPPSLMINCKELSSYTTRFCSPAIGVESFTVTLNSCEGLVTVCPFLDVVVILNWKFKTMSSKVLFCFNPSSVETSPAFG